MTMWAGSSVVRTFASQVKGRGFKSHPVHKLNYCEQRQDINLV